MAKILCPNKGYTGISASVAFVDGKGETDNPHLIQWFKEHGYTVEGEQAQGGEGGIENMTAKELKAYADEKKIDLGKAKTKPEMIAAIQKAEAEGGENKPDGGNKPDGENDEPKDGEQAQGGEEKTE